jgi:predicted phage tail protein
MKKQIRAISVISCVILICGICGSGCNQTQPLTPEQVQALVGQINSLADQLTGYQAQVTALADSMSSAGLLDPNKADKIVQLNNQIDKVKAQVKQVTAAIASGTYNPNDDTLMTILKVAQAANTATVPFNPYANVIGLALMAIITILGLFAKKKAVALSEVVIANEVFKNAAAPEVAAAFKAAQELHQSEATTKQVSAITA